MVAPHIPAELIEAKRMVRQRMLAAREAWEPACGAALAEHVLREVPPPAGAVVSGFWPMGQEIDIRPLLLALHERGHPIVLPETPKRGNPLIFRLWHPGAAMVRGAFRHVSARRRGEGAGLLSGAAAGVRPARVSRGVWRWVLRPDVGGTAGKVPARAWRMPRRNWTKCRPVPTTRGWTLWRPSAA